MPCTIKQLLQPVFVAELQSLLAEEVLNPLHTWHNLYKTDLDSLG